MSSKQAKLRLLVSHKRILIANAKEHILPRKLKDAYDAAYAIAAPLVRKVIESKFKPAEMAILRKFECAAPYETFKVVYPDGSIQQFQFRADKSSGDRGDNTSWPIVPTSNSYRWSTVFAVDDKTAKVVETWVDTKAAYEKEYSSRRLAYEALITGANYLEDLLDVWPEAATLVPRTGGAILALGPTQIEAIKRDLEEQRAAAK